MKPAAVPVTDSRLHRGAAAAGGERAELPPGGPGSVVPPASPARAVPAPATGRGGYLLVPASAACRCSLRNRSASSAAAHPEPAAVTAWR